MIRAVGLEKRYGPVRAVDGVAFEVRRGEVVGFLGPNGAGKSTTMRMLAGCLHPDAGRVEIGGEPMGAGRLEARARLGYLPEHTPLYRGMRVADYLAFVAELRGLRRAARRAALERVLAACDLEGWERRPIGGLSKGYRQRVGLAQALVADPEVLVLDEPTSGLDPAEIVRIRDLVLALAREKTILLSTHVLPEVEEVCRRAIILAGGRIVADGSLQGLADAQGEWLGLRLSAREDEARAALASLEGVRAVRVLGRGEAGRLRLSLEVEERYAVAERVARLLADRGWPLFELRHEVPTLERVFLERTRGGAAAIEGPAETRP